MADRASREASPANSVREAEYQLGQALAQPAGPGRLDRIAKADAALSAAETEYQDCLDGTGDPRAPLKR